MRILVKNHFENAFAALKANRGRAFLTVVGMTIGTASITMVLSLAGGISSVFGGKTPHITTPAAIIRSGGQPTNYAFFTELDDHTNVNTLTEKDAQDIAKINDINSAPISFVRTTLKGRNGKIDTQQATVIGSTNSLLSVADLQLAEGEFTDDVRGIVVGQQLSIDLFGTEHSIGNVITIRNQPFTVVGVLKKYEKLVDYLPIDFNTAAITPLAVSRQFTGGVAQIQQIAITAKTQEQLARGVDESKQLLQKNHAGDEDYRVLVGDEINEQNTKLIRLFSVILALIGGISLLVGSIGVMNSMLVNVAERQREIGIRRAVGATSGHIINQFLIESAIIGLLGGLLGYVVGVAGIHLISLYLPFTPHIYWQTAVVIIVLSIIIGIFAGIYPAAHATRRDPIESLRQ